MIEGRLDKGRFGGEDLRLRRHLRRFMDIMYAIWVVG